MTVQPHFEQAPLTKLEQDLNLIGSRLARHRAAVDADVLELHARVREARATGLPLRRIAALSGLSFARIAQIEKEA